MATSSKAMIENSDRGVTLNKSLAWTMFAAIVSLVWWGGSTITSLQSATQQLAEAVKQIQAKQDRDGDEVLSKFSINDGRIRTLEQLGARTGAQYENLSQSLSEVKTEQRQTNELLRQILQGKIK